MNFQFLCDVFRKNRDYSTLVDALKRPAVEKRKPYYVSGLADGVESLFLESLAEDIGSAESPLLLIFADEKKAVRYREFLGSVGLEAAYFPSREYCFNNITSSHEYENVRLQVLAALIGMGDSPAVICTTAEAVLQVTMPAKRLSDLCVRISYDDSVDLDALVYSLGEAGYSRVELVESVGQFAVRGGILDVYPAGDSPVRLELFGDEVDRIGYFSVETQRFLDSEPPEEIVLPPVREHILTEEDRKLLADTIRRHIRRLGKTEGADEKHSRAATVLQSELSSIEHGLEINFADKYLPFLYPDGHCLLDYIDGTIVVLDSAAAEERFNASNTLTEQSIAGMSEALELPPVKAGIYLRTFTEIGERQEGPVVFVDALTRAHSGLTPADIFAFNTRHLPAYSGNIALLSEDIARFSAENYLSVIVCGSEIERENVQKKLSEDGYTAVAGENTDGLNIEKIGKSKFPVLLMIGECSGGFELAYPKLVVMDFSNDSAKPTRLRVSMKKQKRKKSATEAILSYADLEVGDIVVHEAYGIGQYMGLENLTIDGSSRDYVHIKYAGSDKLFLPIDQLDHVSKYIGAGSDTGMVKLSKMNGTDWTKAKSRAKASAKEMAKELIELYARRKRTPGFAFEPDDDMCREFADAFEYEETDGQLEAINDVRHDMEQPYPMDRLLCGDVGYGKTEVALRAAFKAVMGGKQVAVLVPTTILAYQHYQTFKSRMRAFPVNIDMVSRFRTAKEQDASIRKVKRGDTDIIIGTHRLISKDVEFHNLGLIIIDEEQRFGVAQKDKLKKLQVGADILTLTATPIPRTLNMAMGGIVDMSVLEEAPGLRTPVQTYVMEYDDAIIHEAIRRELRRGGQVFYLYNRVEGIFNVADRISAAIPDARIAVAHGKMEREAIEDVWNSLIRGDVDILVCTTIIETGVDIPNANTLIIEHAENYGLSQLHQLRGRVGRSSTRAYAYFTYKSGKSLTEIAEKRLAAIREYAEFGAGFRIALRDLEIRGAGNLLGAEQHGHMEAVGYDMYMKLLEEAVIEEKGELVKTELPECAVDVRCDAYLTKSYISSAPQRMDMYKRIARVANEDDYNDILDELCDRYGEPNSAAVNLCRIAWIRAMGRVSGFSKIEEKEEIVKLYTQKIDAGAVQRLAGVYPTLGVKVMLGANPYVLLKCRKGVRNTEFLLELMQKYCSFITTK